MTEKEYEAFERRYLTSYSGVGVALSLMKMIKSWLIGSYLEAMQNNQGF